MKKFKIGDMVKFECDRKRGIGKIVDTDRGSDRNRYLLELQNELKGTGHNALEYDTEDYWFVPMDSPSLKLVKPTQEIHITTDDETTHAILKEAGKVTKRSTAKCSSNDAFYFAVGARLAMERLFEKSKPFIPHLERRGRHYGVIGKPTKMRDITNTPLHIGDVIELVDEKRINYGVYMVAEDEDGMFVDSIAGSCWSDGTINDEWIVVKRKSFEALQDGECVGGITAVLKPREGEQL